MPQITVHKKDLTMLKLAVATIMVCILIDEASAAPSPETAPATPIERVAAA